MIGRGLDVAFFCGLFCVAVMLQDSGLCAVGVPAAPGKTIRESLPAIVRQLSFEWDEAPPAPGQRAVGREESASARQASEESIGWIEKVVAEGWRPEKAVLAKSLVMVGNKFDSRDATRAEWETGGYRFVVSQTRTVITVVISAVSGDLGWKDRDARTQGALGLAKLVIGDVAPDKISVLPGGKSGHELAPDGAKAILLDSSFVRGRQQEFADGIAVTAAPMDMADPVDLARMARWWRRVGWWTDGKSFGFYTLKIETGPWAGNYEDNPPWFSGER